MLPDVPYFLQRKLPGRHHTSGSLLPPEKIRQVIGIICLRPGEYLPVYENERGTYIFNSKDLCMIEHIPELLEAGIDSFKIEGRMKTALYVAAVARTYYIASTVTGTLLPSGFMISIASPTANLFFCLPGHGIFDGRICMQGREIQGKELVHPAAGLKPQFCHAGLYPGRGGISLCQLPVGKYLAQFHLYLYARCSACHITLLCMGSLPPQ